MPLPYMDLNSGLVDIEQQLCETNFALENVTFVCPNFFPTYPN